MNPSTFQIVLRATARKKPTWHVLVLLGAGMLLGMQLTVEAQSSVRRGGLAGSLGAEHPTQAIAGVVRDASGAPQIGALVELMSPNLAVIARTFTDDHGHYALPAAGPGTYEVKASGSFFLPTLRENLRLLANSKLVVNLTLNTLYEAFQWLPAQPRPVDEPRDDWNWTLRLSTNRPLLRVLEEDSGAGPTVIVSDGATASALDRRITVRSGANRFGEGGMHQDVEVERDHDDAHQLILRTDLGQADSASIRSTAAYYRQLTPQSAIITVASFSDRPDVLEGTDSGLQVMTLRSAATMSFGPDVSAEIGDELETVHLGQTLAIAHPFANFSVHHGQTTARYRMASSPDAQQASELDRDATLSPRVSEHAGSLAYEQGLHQAIEIEHRFPGGATGHWTAGATYFHDAIDHPLVGGGVAILNEQPALTSADLHGGNLLYDPATQLIAVAGESYAGSGLVAIARDQLTPESWLSFRYAVGEAVAMQAQDEVEGALPTRETLSQAVGAMRPRTASTVAASVGSIFHRSGTVWRASYRWQPSATLTQVAPFDAAAPEAYLSFHMRQPIQMHYMGVRGMQAILDVRNLLAQGYQPFLSQDGSTLYFAQAERCVEGGLSFSF